LSSGSTPKPVWAIGFALEQTLRDATLAVFSFANFKTASAYKHSFKIMINKINNDLSIPINSFCELIKFQEGLLMRLAAVSLKQLEFVFSGDMTSLMQLLGKKYQLLDEYDEIRKALCSHGEIDPDLRQWNNEGERIDAKNSIEHCKQLLDEIMDNDKRSMEEIEIRRDDLQKEICRFDRVAQTHLGYAKAARTPTNVKHFDIKEK
jgi:hypothetical protein